MSEGKRQQQLGDLATGSVVHTLTGLVFTIMAQRPDTRDVYIKYRDTGSTEHIDARSPVHYSQELQRWEMGVAL